MIKEKLRLIQDGKLSCYENIKGFIDKIKKEDKKINSVLHINEDALFQASLVDKKIKSGGAGKLAGLGFLVKSNINVLGLICNCASKTLENYKATYNATVILKLLEEDAIVLGMTNMDEFACGASGESSAFGVCKNPKDLSRIPGGSSSGSCAAVAADFCDFSLGSDTGGSIRNPSSHCGVYGFKPSYGAVSRYGLIDLSMSLDQIGPIGNCVNDCKLIFDIIKGKDVRDSVSRDFNFERKDLKKIKIGIPKISADKKIWDLVMKRVDLVCKKNNWKKEEISLNHIDLGIQTYYPIVYVEFFSGTRRFDGRKYGHIIEETCGEEVLRRIVGGEIISQKEFSGTFYRRALKAKKIIEKELDDAFIKNDILIMPTVPRLPHKFGEKISLEDMYNYDTLTVLANLGELCSISIPCGEIDGTPIGMQVLSKKGSDDFLLEVCERI